MTSLEAGSYIVGGLILLPILVYLCVKVGTFAFFKGRQKFYDTNGKDDHEQSA